ncbi:MAG: YciI family protein [Streptosporangiaceae bacterium]
MTQYLLAVHMVEGEPERSPAETQQAYAAVDAFNAELQKAGCWVFAGGLHPPATATVVHSRSGQVITTDGPFAESKEQLGGFWIISAPDLDAALDWAARGSAACGGPVEVRPFQEIPES